MIGPFKSRLNCIIWKQNCVNQMKIVDFETNKNYIYENQPINCRYNENCVAAIKRNHHVLYINIIMNMSLYRPSCEWMQAYNLQAVGKHYTEYICFAFFYVWSNKLVNRGYIMGGFVYDFYPSVRMWYLPQVS